MPTRVKGVSGLRPGRAAALGRGAFGRPPIAPVMPAAWGLVLLLAFAGRVVGQAALAAASRRPGALGTSAVALGEPATAALLAIWLIGAPFFPVRFVCIAALCAGIWMCWSRLPTARAARHPAPTAAE